MARLFYLMETAKGIRRSGVFRQGAAVAALIAVAAISVGPAAAQARVGGHGLYKSQLVNGTYGYGGRVEFDLGFLVDQLVAGGTYERLSPECAVACEYWEAGGQAGFQSGIGYLGMGLFFSRFENTGAAGQPTIEDDWIFALLGSIRYPLKGFITPFFEIRNELGEGILNSQSIVLGILLGPYSGGSSRTSARRTR